MRSSFWLSASLMAPSCQLSASFGQLTGVATWGKACGAKHDTSARKRMSMRVSARMMALDSAKDLVFNGHRSNEIKADMITECWRLRGANRGVRRDGNK